MKGIAAFVAATALGALLGAQTADGAESVVFQQSFDSFNPGDIPYGTGEDGDLLVTDDCDGPTKCMRVMYEPTSQGSRRLSEYVALTPDRNYTASFHVFFERGFQWVRGGKLPALLGGSPALGCKPVASDGWAARLMWGPGGVVILELYDQDRTGNCGTLITVNSFTLSTKRWYHFELSVLVNEPGKTNGNVRLAVDGNTLLVVPNLRLRGSVDPSIALVDNFLFSTFYGGSDSSWAPSKTTYSRFDNFVVKKHAEDQSNPTMSPAPSPVDPPTSTLSPTRSPTSQNGCRNQLWSQCGGRKYAGLTCCPADSHCIRIDNTFFQCVPQENIYWQSFDAFSQGSRPFETGEAGDLVVLDDCNGHIKCLRTKYEPQPMGSRRLVAYEPLLPASLEYTASYDLYFEVGFEWVRGGKLPGLSGGSATTGCSPMVPSGWSTRLMWKSEGTLILYIYDQQRTTSCGNNVVVNGFTFETSRWYHIELYVRVNTPGQQDGEVALAVDGVELVVLTGMELRGDVDPSTALVDNFMFSTFYGGSDSTWAPSKTTYARFDNFAVSHGRFSESLAAEPREPSENVSSQSETDDNETDENQDEEADDSSNTSFSWNGPIFPLAVLSYFHFA